jgi:GNAT superfamily N-acetyltransferase
MKTILEPASAAFLSELEDNRCELWSLFSRLPGAEIHDQPDSLQIVTNEPFGIFNTVHRAQFAAAEADAAVEAAIARARARGVRLMWFVGPTTRPARLATTLRAHGFVHDSDALGMAVDLAQLPEAMPLPPGLEIAEATSEEDVRTWCKTMVAGFGMGGGVADSCLRWLLGLDAADRSSVHLFLGRLDGVPVATHLLVLGSGSAGIHFFSTLPEARGRGVGGAVCLNTLREGRARGYEVGVTEAEGPAVGTCHRMGFRDYYRVSVYMWRDGATSAPRGRIPWKRAIAAAARRLPGSAKPS